MCSAATPDPYPLGGLVRIASKPWYAWPLFALSTWALVLLLVKRLRTPFNLIFSGGVLAGVGFTVMFFVGGGGVALVLLAGYLVHVARGESAQSS